MKRNRILPLLTLSGIVLFSSCSDNKSEKISADDPRFSGQKFREHIRSTEARTPEEERAGFRLPEGFEIEFIEPIDSKAGRPKYYDISGYTRVWQGSYATPDSNRKEIYEKAQKILVEDVPVAWMLELQFPTIMRCKVKNLITTGIGVNDGFKDAWLDK